MSKKLVKEYSAFFEGISDFPKTGGVASYAKGRSVDHRTDTRSLRLLPRTIKESGTTITDLVKWITTPPSTCQYTYLYGDAGNIYQRDSNGAYTFLRTVPNSHGNGIGWFGEDNFIYYTSDSLIGRYGPICNNPTFNDNFFGSQGGVRTNTNSIELLSASTQYLSRASTASLQITGNLSGSAQIYPYTLPTVGETQTIFSKWTEAGNLRSYKWDIIATSNFFGDGSDGALVISSNTTEAPIDSACTGTASAYTLTATNASFAAGQIIYIHQTQGSGAGAWQKNTIQSYTAGTITLVDPLNFTYTTGAQVRVLPQYTDVTVNAGVTWTAKAWNGTTGGILGFIANGTVTINGTISANEKGFRGASPTAFSNGKSGEGTPGLGSTTYVANGNGGGGVNSSGSSSSGAGGGGNGTVGGTGGIQHSPPGQGGGVSGSADLTSISLGGGGGSATDISGSGSNTGGTGGGIILLWGATLTVASTGSVTANGGTGGTPSLRDGSNNPATNGGAGGGAGGSLFIKTVDATLDTLKLVATGGTGGTGVINGSYNTQINGGNGGNGRIHADYATTITGTTNPTLNSLQDASLSVSNGNSIRLQISSNGTNVETYSKPITLQVNTWQQIGVVFTASTSTVEFFLNGVSLGTQVGALTSINSNASVFNIGRYLDGASATQGLYNGLIDEVQVFNVVRTAQNYLLSIADSIVSTTTGLQAYYQLNGAVTDSTANANTLTASGSPEYSDNVPFLGATTRVDIDQSQTLTGQTYTVPVAITENAANELEFTPTKDPQKSLAVTVVAIGTGDWTLITHDQYDNTIATKTVTNANMSTGVFEFTFTTAWRPQINQDYHFHLTSTVADGTVQTGTTADLSTAWYRTYYSFLVEDTQYHPVSSMLQFLVFGNERYVATLEATLYEPNAITLPAGWKVRCFGYWNEYLAIGAWQGTTVDQFDQGRIFFWDGISSTYNFFIDVPEGAINAMIGSKGRLYFIAGSRCKLLVYEGGAQARKVKNLVNSENSAVIDVFPGSMTMWKTLIRFGVAGNNQDTDVQLGGYTWGSVNEKYPDSLSFDYPISTGNYTGTNIKIGAMYPVNSDLLIAWKDITGYGVDIVSVDNPPYPTGTIEFLIEDDDAMYHEKEAITMTSQFEPLVSGESIALKYKLNRSSDWTTFTAQSTVGENTERKEIISNGSRYREYEIGIDLATTTTTSPVLLGASLEKDILDTEKRVG